jgi:CHAT domain-containing protein
MTSVPHRGVFAGVSVAPLIGCGVLVLLAVTPVGAQNATIDAAPQRIDSLLQDLEHATAAGDSADIAAAMNDLGVAYLDAEEPLLGLAAFADAERLAPAASALALIAAVNATRALHEVDSSVDIVARLDQHAANARALGDEPAMTPALLVLAQMYLSGNDAHRVRLGGDVHQILTTALELAAGQDDDDVLGRAYGELGAFYAAAQRPEEALAATRRAVLVAQRTGTASLYRWEWQTARLLRARGDESALLAYGAAIRSLNTVQSAAAKSRRGFRRDVLPLYREYANVMLARAHTLDGAAAAAALTDVQRNVELLRIAEVRDYFENQCTVPDRTLASVGPADSLVIYPMLFDDRIELLVSTGRSLQQFTVDVSLAELTSEVRLLRDTLENDPAGREFLAPAGRLYGWLIAPLRELLATTSPRTLVFVPDGVLRTIPLAVLHDGERFLVEQYALATTPSLSLVTHSAAPAVSRVLVNGIVEPVRGYPGLPFVAAELDSVRDAFPARVYRDESFTTTNLEREIVAGDYNIVHMATHAQFEADYRRSFLLAYDDLITMDELEDIMGSRRFTDRPVDLLVLSACATAAGDDRAALGLAGVAVKAGARSALASLWSVSDESTALLMAEFYRQLASGRNKADALRAAQLLVLNDARYAHPMYWAPFLLIGEWQ